VVKQNRRKIVYRYLVLLVVISMAVLVLPACGPTGGGSTAPKEVKVTDKEAGGSVEVAKGGTLEITLEGNPTTGYTWEVESVDDKILKQDGEPEFKAESDAVGAGGMVTLKFKAEEAGETDLKLVYHRPWEEGEDPAETFEVSVTVK
jgi:inhibitor of cysteine peptidase